mgnify:CR=1 FL=1
MIQQKNNRQTLISLALVALMLAVVLVLDQVIQPTDYMSMLLKVLQKASVYALAAVSLNLLTGFTGLFSLGQAGFMLLGAYTYAILTIPTADREAVYYLYNGSAVNFSLPELFGGGALGLILGVLAALILAGCVAAVIAWLIGLPVLRLKSDYLAIATLGFAEIIRAIFQWDRLGPVTNGANALKSFPTFSSFNIENANGEVVLRLSTFVPFLLVAVCIGIMVLLINSTYGRAFKAIREDEVAAEAMGINLAKHKRMAFCISSFFAGVGGGLFAMFANNAQAKVYTSTMTYEILLIVVIGGIYAGMFTATEGGGIGAFTTVFLALVMGRLSWSIVTSGLNDTGKTISMAFTVLGGAGVFSYFMTMSKIPMILAGVIASMNMPPMAVMFAIIVCMSLLGCFIPAIPLMLICVPIFLPLAALFGWNLIWFGVIINILVTMAGMTPPFGVSLFVAKELADVPLSLVYRSSIPFVLAFFLCLGFCIAFEPLSTWLPAMMR